MNEIESRLSAGGDQDRWTKLKRSLVDRADQGGLLEVAYERHDSPFGTMLVAASREGLVRVALPSEDESEVLAGLARKVSPRLASTARGSLTETRSQLDSYFEGKLLQFDLPLDWRLTGGFRREVLWQATTVPYGSTVSYGELARRAGSPKASRAAGTALATNPLPIVVPCHRILRSDGKVGAYLGGTAMKQALLQLERGSATR